MDKYPIGLKVQHLDSKVIATITEYSICKIYGRTLYKVRNDTDSVYWYQINTTPFGKINRLLYG